MKRFFAAILLALSFVTVSLAQDSANLFRPTPTPPNPPCPYSRLFMNVSNQMALVSCTGTVTVIGTGGGGSGTVTSVGLSLPAIFSVSGSPVTASGTLTATLATQTANLVFAGPTSGGSAAPTFRALVSADIPNLDAAKITSGTIATARLGSGTANSTTFLRGDQTWAVPSFTVTGVPDAINAVRDYGCVGDDVANDTTCLTNALAAAALTTGKALYLRTGTYKTTAKLAVPGGVTLYGDGREKTIIHGTANDTILELKAGTGLFLFEGPTIRNLSVYGSSSGANQIGVSVDDAVGPDFYINGAWIENISVYQTGSHGVYFGRAFSSTFKRIYASAPVSGYPFLFNQLNMPGNTFEALYAQDVNATNPAGFRIRTGDIDCWGCNGINNSSSNSWWAILGDKIGQDGATSNASAYFTCWGCNIESSKAGGIWHYSDSTSYLDGRTLFAGDASGSGTYVALKYEVTTPGSGGLPAAQPKGKLGPLVVFANSPLSFYANSEVIHANDLPPVTVEGDIRQADGAIISSYRNTTNSRSEKIFRLDARMPVTTITASANFTQPAATNYEANCALGCTLTLPFAGYWASMEQLIYIRNIGVGTLVVNGNSGSSINGGGSYSLASGESVTFIPHSASADYRLVGVGGSGVANRITYWNDVQHVTSSANLTYDGTTVLNQRAGGNPFFAANDTTNGITTRFGPLAGAPDRAIIGTTSNHPLGLYANNAERWTIGTTGHLTPGAATTYNIGSASLPINDLTIGGKLYWTGSTIFDWSGSGSPEGVVTAGIGSVYRRTNGSTGTTFYIKESGTGNTGWSALGGAGAGGITTLNGLTTATQSFAVGTSGTDFAVSSATSTHTFNLPDAGASARGVITTGTQTIAGAKTVTSIFTANPGTTPTTGILVDIATLGSAGTRDSNWLVFRGRSNDGSAHLTEWKLLGDVTSNAGASKFSFQTRIDAGSFAEVFSVDDVGLVQGGDFSGDTFTAGVGFVGDGSGLTAMDASQLTTGTVAANRGGAGTNSGILQANGSGTVGTVTAGTGITYSGTTLSVNQAFTPTWSGGHTFTATMTAREIDPQTDNTYDLGTTSLRWKTVHVGPGSVVVHNDATNTLKATLGFSGSTAQLTTDSSTPLQLRTGANNGIFLNTNGTVGFNLATSTNGNFDFRQIANGDQIINLRRATDTSPTGNFINFENAAGTDLFTVDIAGSLAAGTIPTARLNGAIPATNFPALTGDVTTVAGNLATTIANNAVTNAKLAQVATATFKGRTTAGTGNVEDLTATQATALLDAFTSSAKGLAPASGGGTTNFLRADGAWAAPSGGGAVSSVSNSDTTLTISPTTGAVVASLNLAKANTWTALTTLNLGTTPANALLLDIATLGSTGTRNSHDITWRGRSNDGSTHSVEWRSFVSVTSNAGASKWALFSRIDGGTSTERFTVGDAGDVVAGNFSGTGFADDGGSVLDDDVNAATGFTVAGAAASGQYLRGDGTRAVFSAILSGDLPSTVVRTDQANTYSTGAQSFASATSFTVAVAAGAAPTGSGQVAYDSTAGFMEYGDGGVNRTFVNTDEAQTLTNKAISGSTNTLSAIGNSSLVNSSITIAGTPTSLGSSISQDTITGLGSTGLVARTATNTLTPRTLSAGSASITITNGNGASGNPTVDTAQNIQTNATPQFARMGLGTAAGGAALLTIAGGTVTADSPVLDLAQTWNSGAVTFNGIKLNVTNTASGALSKLMDLQVGGSSQFSVDRSGTVAATTFNATSAVNIGGVSALSQTNTVSGITNKTFDGFAMSPTTTSASNTLTSSQAVILCNASGAIRTQTLPAAASNSGRIYTLKKTDTSANACIFDGNASETIDGNLTISLTGQYDSSQIISDGTNWFRLGQTLVSAQAGIITGLVLEYVSTTQVRVSSGSAQIQSTGQMLVIPSALTISPSLASSTWYHCYVFDNSGIGALECVTTAPATPWVGTARSKTSVPANRYVGSFRTNSSSQVINFVNFSAGSEIDSRYRNAVDLENRVLSNGSATTNTTINPSTFVPVTAQKINVRMTNLATAGFVYFDTGELNPAAGNGHYGLGVNSVDGAYLLLDTSQQFRYAYSSTPTGSNFLYIDVVGFVFYR